MAVTSAPATGSRTSPAPPAGARLESLTGLRWWAAFGVFLAHVDVLLPIPGTRGVFGLGVVGVTFFFVLSGFVLTWTATGTDSAGWFYARRFARIWPLLTLSVVLPLVFALTAKQVGTPVDKGHLAVIAVLSILLVQAWVPGWILNGPSPVTWSLSCEAFFYLLFPPLLKPMVRRTVRWLLWLIVAMVLVGWAIRIGMWIKYPPKKDITADDFKKLGVLELGTYAPIARLNEFVMGVAAALILRRVRRFPVSVRTASALLFAGFFVLWLMRKAVWRSQVPYDAVDQVCAPLFALLIAAVASRDLAGGRSMLSSRWLVRLGKWSYAFYLFQFTVLVAFASKVYPKKGIPDFFLHPVSPEWSHVGPALTALFIAVGLSALLYRFYEHPLELRLRARLRRLLPSARAAAPVAPPAAAPAASKP